MSACRRNPLRAVITACIAIGAGQLAAEEITVRNDSVENFQQVAIVGDFVEGEHAGVRLEAPCTGEIVAVQILWLQGTPGHGDSLEGAIHIYDDGVFFPSPGNELLLLEGPVLSPGFMNEWRYLDEAQTLPINVPVNKFQNFYVTLEFYNPTDVNNGGPSVVRDLDDCTSQSNVVYATPGFWLDLCSVTTGDFVIRVVMDCPGATGACCYADGACTENVEELDCLAEYGAVWHEGLACSQITCEPRGACCIGAGCLQLTAPDDCANASGTYAGHGSNCADDVCIQGACCNPNTGECTLEFAFDCTAAGGDYQGAGTACDPNPCPQPTGACCIGTFCFPDQLELNCVQSDGTWAGPDSTCDDGNSNGTADVCEAGGYDAGDVNCDGAINFGDIDPFVLALTDAASYAAAFPDCDINLADVSGDGSVNFGDIDPFVALLTD